MEERSVSTQNLLISVFQALTASMMLASAALSADEASPSPSAPSKEMRAQMASVHERMAACLRSDKAFVDCRSDMMKNCREVVGERGCPMMGVSMHRHMMERSPATSPKDK
jgi:hypothetical protein